MIIVVFLLSFPLPGICMARAINRGILREDSLCRLFIYLLVSVAATSVTALAAALAGVFSLPLVAAANCAIAALLWCAARTVDAGKQGGAFLSGGKISPLSAGAAIIVIAAATGLFFQPHEYLFGGWDPGVYINTGAHIARSGSLSVDDRGLASIDPDDQPLFYHVRRGLDQKYPGFVVRDRAGGKVQPYFYHLYPVWIALFDALFGLKGGFFAAPFFALLSLWAFYLLGKYLFSRGIGFLAVLLLTLNTAQIWQSRFPTSETTAQFFLLSGLLVMILFVKEETFSLAAVAALAFGCAMLTKITASMTVASTGLFFASALIVSPRRRLWLFPLSLAAMSAAVVPYYLTACRESTAVVFSIMSGGSLYRLAVLLPAGAAAAGALIFAIKRGKASLTESAEVPLRAALSALIVAMALYAYFLRPMTGHGGDSANLVHLGWFLSPLGIVLSVGGVLYTLQNREDLLTRERLLFLLIFLFVAVFFLYQKKVAPFYMWAVRRYVPLVVPGALLFCAVAIGGIARSAGRRRYLLPVPLILLALVIGAGFRQGKHLLAHSDYKGALEQVGQVARIIPEEGIVIGSESWLVTPLQYLHGKNTLQVSDVTLEKGRRLLDLMERWVGEGREVYFLTHNPRFFTSRLAFRLEGRVQMDMPLLARSSSLFPRTIRRFRPDVHLFRVLPAAGKSDGGFTGIDVATAFFGLGKGFSPPGRITVEGRRINFRWTAAEAALEVAAPPTEGEGITLELSLAAGRPRSDLPLPRVEVFADNVHVGAFTVGNEFGPYEVTIPRTVAEEAGGAGIELRLKAETFNPKALELSSDARDLGVMWESVALKGSPL